MKSLDPLDSLLREARREAHARKPAPIDLWTASGFVLIDHDSIEGLTSLGLFREFTYRDGRSHRYVPAPGIDIPSDVRHLSVHGDHWLRPVPAPRPDLEDPPWVIKERFLELMKELDALHG